MLVGNTIGGKPMMPKTCVFRNENGQEFYATLVDSKYIMTAGVNDIREGKTAITDAGMTTGEKVIPPYHTCQGIQTIPNGSPAIISNIESDIDMYDFTALQAIICSYNTSAEDSVAAEKIVLNDKVYNVRSSELISTVTKNHETQSIDLGIVNESGTTWVIRYFMYKEVY